MVRHLRQRLARFLAALVILAVIVVGLPALFVYSTRVILHSSNPSPTRVSLDGARSWVGHHLATSEIVTVLARALLMLGWVMWAILVIKIITAFARAVAAARFEVAPVVRTGTPAPAVARPTSPMRGSAPAAVTGGRLDGFARWLVTGFTIATISLPSVTTNAAAGPRVTAVASLPHTATSHPDTPADRSAVLVDRQVDVGGSMVRVEFGETAETFAARTLGDAERWHDIWDLNQHQIVDNATGTRWTEPWNLRAGWVLQLPATSTVEPPESATADTVVVEPGDTLWGIIETRTGHVTLADVIAVAEANDGTTSPDGHRFHASNPALINPGQRFILHAGDTAPTPDAAAGDPAPVAGIDSAAPSSVSVPTGTTPPAGPVVAPTPVAADVTPPMPISPPTSTPTLTTPEAPRPTETVSIPSSLPAPHANGNRADQASVTNVDAASANVTNPDTVDSTEPAGVPLARLVGWAGSAAAAAGLLALARRLRHRHPRRRSRPTEQLRDIDLVLRITDNVTTTQWAATTLRALAHQLGQQRRAVGDIACIHAGDRGLELLWNTPQPNPPDTWTTTDGGWTWHHQRHHTPGPTGPVAAPCPTLVTIGRLDNGDDVLVNLETAGTLHLTGTNARDVARGFVIELATSPYMDVTQILLCGISLDGIDQYDWIQPVTVTEAAGRLTDTATTTAANLTDHPSLLALRARDRDAHSPVVVIVDADHTSPDALADLEAAAGPAAVLVTINRPEPADTGWTLTCDGDSARLDPHGFIVATTRVDEAMAVKVAAYLADAADATITDVDLDALLDPHPVINGDVGPDPCLFTADEASLCSPRFGIDPDQITPVDAGDNGEPDDDPFDVHGPFDVLLRILGTVTSTPPPARAFQAKELELVVFLALHRDGKTADTIRTMLWPESVSDQRWRNVSSQARLKLGVHPDGTSRLHARGTDRRYRLDTTVITDWDLFLGYARAAHTAPTPKALDYYRHALTFIDGPPFADIETGYSWAFADGTVTEMTTTIRDVAQHAAELALDANDPQAALWCIARAHRAIGLRVDAQALTQLEMVAHIHAGQPGAALNAYQQLRRDLDEIDPGLEPDAAIVELHRQITGHARTP